MAAGVYKGRGDRWQAQVGHKVSTIKSHPGASHMGDMVGDSRTRRLSGGFLPLGKLALLSHSTLQTGSETVREVKGVERSIYPRAHRTGTRLVGRGSYQFAAKGERRAQRKREGSSGDPTIIRQELSEIVGAALHNVHCHGHVARVSGCTSRGERQSRHVPRDRPLLCL